MKLSRDTWLAAGLILAFVVVGVLSAIQQTEEQAAPPLASFSNAPNGSLAFSLWLDQLGYDVRDDRLENFILQADLDLLFILEPRLNITEEEWTAIDDWVEAGGTLVLAGDGFGSLIAADHYEIILSYLGKTADSAIVQNPLFTSPPPSSLASVKTRAVWQTERSDVVSHLAIPEGPVMVSFNQGDGRVFLSATSYPFSNAGLKESGNPALAVNPAALSGPGSQVRFDEWHHGIRAAAVQVTGPENWLRYTPAGRSILFTALVIFLGLVLNGRRFGRPIPPPGLKSRRAPVEYITAIANLNRRAGHRTAVLRQYTHWLKRGLGRRYRLDPTLPDTEFVRRLAAYNPTLNKAALSRLLADLRQPDVSENRLVELAAAAADWLKNS